MCELDKGIETVRVLYLFTCVCVCLVLVYLSGSRVQGLVRSDILCLGLKIRVEGLGSSI